MSSQEKIPGPDHPITITPTTARITVSANGQQIADTQAALSLKESTYPAVHYIPRKDVDMTQLARSDKQTYCPYKGPCSYFSIPAAGDKGVNAVWTYETPYQSVAAIKEHLAFYTDRGFDIASKG